MRNESDTLDLIRRLSLASGLSGFEQEVTAIIQAEIGHVSDSAETDRIGNAVFTFEPTAESRAADALPNFSRESKIGTAPASGQVPSFGQVPTILLAAHQDEIGFMVASVLPSGFLRVESLGSWNPVTLPSSPVMVINRNKERIPGIIGHISPHFLKDRKSDIPQISELFVDIGAASDREAAEKFSVFPGDLVVPVTSYSWNEKSRTLMSKAFDDRIGIAALIELGLRIAGKPGRENRLLLAATVQEEVGTRGAAVLGNYADADSVIIIEGAPADDIPGGPEVPQTRIRGGAHVRIYDPTMIADPGLIQLIREKAESAAIPIQETVRRGGGTDGRALHLAGSGIPSIVTGVPVRYAHSHNCLIHLDDFYALVDLLEAVCMATGSEILEKGMQR